jgi:large subunit ribosomal protein L22
MEAKARQTDIKMPARKIRRIINEVRGKSVTEAMKILRFMPYFAARVVEKNLTCAIANAAQKSGITSDKLKISEIFADEARTSKRGRPRAQGRMYKRMKRTSHLTIKVDSSDKVK